MQLYRKTNSTTLDAVQRPGGPQGADELPASQGRGRLQQIGCYVKSNRFGIGGALWANPRVGPSEAPDIGPPRGRYLWGRASLISL